MAQFFFGRFRHVAQSSFAGILFSVFVALSLLYYPLIWMPKFVRFTGIL